MTTNREDVNPLADFTPKMGKSLRSRAEARIAGQEKAAKEPLSAQEFQHLFHELHVHQIELEMQNEELRRTQEELEISRARYFDLYNLAPVGYLTLSQKGLILEGNLTLATLLDTPRNRLVKSRLSQYILPADQDSFYNLRKRLEDSECSQMCELRMVGQNGNPFWARLDAVTVQANAETVYRITVSDISEHRQAEQIKFALEGNENLLRELHHRTKNNMLVISSMLVLNARHSKSDETRSVLIDLQGKVQAMALVHQMLYQSHDLSHIDLGDYIAKLLALLLPTYQIPEQLIALRVQLAHMLVVLDVATPCGLVLNELISNALKHGFPDQRKGEFRIELVRAENDEIVLTVADNGVGVPDGFDFRKGRGLGLRTIFAIVEHQLQGTVLFQSKGDGLSCQIRFADTHYAARI